MLCLSQLMLSFEGSSHQSTSMFYRHCFYHRKFLALWFVYVPKESSGLLQTPSHEDPALLPLSI